MLNILLLCIVCFGTVSQAEVIKNFELSGGVGVQSSYVLGSSVVFDKGWVIQPWAKALHKPSGLYVATWASMGFENSEGREIDFTGGFQTTVNGIKLDLSYNFYDFISLREGMHNPKLSLCYLKFSLCGSASYMIPDTGAEPAPQFGLAWSHRWTSLDIGTVIGVTYTGSLYGNKPVTVLINEVSIPVAKTGVELFAKGYIPIAGGTEEKNDVRGIIGFRFAF